MTTGYKFFTQEWTDGVSTVRWNPPNGGPGAWMPRIEGQLALCQRGYHFPAENSLSKFMNVQLCEVEFEETARVVDSDKFCVDGPCRILRQFPGWNERTMRLCATDFAVRVLHHYESVYPNDDRPRRCIEAVRKYAEGLVAKRDLFSVGFAAWEAGLAADSAFTKALALEGDGAEEDKSARAAAHAARAAGSILIPPTHAARAAAWSFAVKAAATPNGRLGFVAAEREWQSRRILEYALNPETEPLALEGVG